MATLKYRAKDGTIKTLGLVSTGGAVTSVNGKTGAVTGLYDSDNPPPYPVTSVNGKMGAVTGLYDSANPPPYPVTSVNGKAGAVTGLYDSSNPPPYPVRSVNGKTGNVNIENFIVSEPVKTEDGEATFTIPANTLANIVNIFAEDGETSLPDGNDDGITISTTSLDSSAYLGWLIVNFHLPCFYSWYISYTNRLSAIIHYKNIGSSSAPITEQRNLCIMNPFNTPLNITISDYY